MDSDDTPLGTCPKTKKESIKCVCVQNVVWMISEHVFLFNLLQNTELMSHKPTEFYRNIDFIE